MQDLWGFGLRLFGVFMVSVSNEAGHGVEMLEAVVDEASRRL